MNLGGLDVVYFVGKNIIWKNNELRYSLRSIKNIEHKKVYIVGYLPKFIRKNQVVHIPVQDNEKFKLAGQISKYRAACSFDGLSDDFILMNEKLFILNEIKEVQKLYKDTLRDSIENHSSKSGSEYEIMLATEKLLLANKIKKPLDYSIDQPFVVNKEKMLKIVNLCGQFLPEITQIDSVYKNFFWRKKELGNDTKIKDLSILDSISNESYISVSDELLAKSGFRFWIDRKFQSASVYEVEGVQDDIEEEITYTAPRGANLDGTYYSPGAIIRGKKISPEVVAAQGLKVIETL